MFFVRFRQFQRLIPNDIKNSTVLHPRTEIAFFRIRLTGRSGSVRRSIPARRPRWATRDSLRRKRASGSGAKTAPDDAPSCAGLSAARVRRSPLDTGFQPPHRLGIPLETEHVHRRRRHPANPGGAHQAQHRLELQEQQPHLRPARFGNVRQPPAPGEIEPAGACECEHGQRAPLRQPARFRLRLAFDEKGFAGTHVIRDPRPEQAVGNRVRQDPHPAVRQALPAWSMGLTGPVDPGVPLEEPDRSPEGRLPATHGAGPDSGRFGTAGRGDDCRGSCGTAPVRRDSASRSCRRSGQTDCRPGNGFRAP